jgi:hypothetical protein
LFVRIVFKQDDSATFKALQMSKKALRADAVLPAFGFLNLLERHAQGSGGNAITAGVQARYLHGGLAWIATIQNKTANIPSPTVLIVSVLRRQVPSIAS